MPKCIAVIGAGFIGRNLLRRLLLEGHEVRVLDRNTMPLEFSGSVTWVRGDFHSPDALQRVLGGVDVVYHLVSSTVPGDLHVGASKELEENVIGTLRLIDLCVQLKVARIVFTSSASVYGLQEHLPIAESATTWPISAHGIHKLAVEKFLYLAHLHNKIEVCIARISNPYGPGQSLSGRQGFVAIAMGCLYRGEILPLSNGGAVVRDFIFIDDVVAGLLAAGCMRTVPLVANIASGEGERLDNVAALVGALAGRAIATHATTGRRVDIPSSILDTSLARRELAFAPLVSLRQGLMRTLSANGIALADSDMQG